MKGKEGKGDRVCFFLKSIAYFRVPRARHQLQKFIINRHHKTSKNQLLSLTSLSSKYYFVMSNERKLIRVTSIISSKNFTPLRTTPGAREPAPCGRTLQPARTFPWLQVSISCKSPGTTIPSSAKQEDFQVHFFTKL